MHSGTLSLVLEKQNFPMLTALISSDMRFPLL